MSTTIEGMLLRRCSLTARLGSSPSPSHLLIHLRTRRHPYSTTKTTTTSEGKVTLETYPSRTSPGTIAKITISNPTKMNIVSTPILTELHSTLTTLSTSHPTLRAVILTGGPTSPGKSPAFIGGANITEMAQLTTPSAARSFISRISAVNTAIRSLPVPVIARVHGYTLGAGLEIMASTDLRIATRQSVFGMPEVKVGIPSVVEAALLPGLIGMGRTRRLLLLAENVSAEVAERWGLVERVVEGERELDEVVEEWAEGIAGMGPRAMRIQKRLMQRWEECGVEEGIRAGVDAFAEAFEDGAEEPREFLGRFVNRKKG